MISDLLIQIYTYMLYYLSIHLFKSIIKEITIFVHSFDNNLRLVFHPVCTMCIAHLYLKLKSVIIYD